ncbi:CGNR zinc finger domain-containing protein [Herbiconiux sp. CPCC 205716]|uniref:CGNR zinc finger domain-containing protein n=1 Tax=Herbiconiux gentiana TaxID=2970912 RepID=A0ABT2GI36_9MICO|nr:CGNR zinc finger domain-containing protein [Herbiconiux gentiana]MCS5714930.1 CGNR zinc finger domain-containing protein [Herbiconiux gentiana]
MSTIGPQAPGELEFVRAFVNSVDLETGVDALRDEASWREWARAAGAGAAGAGAAGADAAGVDAAASVSPAALRRARAFREELRLALLANHDREPLPASTAAALTAAARRTRVELLFAPSGVEYAGATSGLDGVVARVVAATAGALADGSWSRLKACRNDACRWGFYDHSRSRTGQWCSMAICGNRAKQTRWRTAGARVE